MTYNRQKNGQCGERAHIEHIRARANGFGESGGKKKTEIVFRNTVGEISHAVVLTPGYNYLTVSLEKRILLPPPPDTGVYTHRPSV